MLYKIIVRADDGSKAKAVVEATSVRDALAHADRLAGAEEISVGYVASARPCAGSGASAVRGRAAPTARHPRGRVTAYGHSKAKAKRLRQAIRYHWQPSGTLRTSAGIEVDFDKAACARMREFTNYLEGLSTAALDQLEAGMVEICAGERCACAGQLELDLGDDA
jgi:hypothetical protein